jgi:hypothetical protein
MPRLLCGEKFPHAVFRDLDLLICFSQRTRRGVVKVWDETQTARLDRSLATANSGHLRCDVGSEANRYVHSWLDSVKHTASHPVPGQHEVLKSSNDMSNDVIFHQHIQNHSPDDRNQQPNPLRPRTTTLPVSPRKARKYQPLSTLRPGFRHLNQPNQAHQQKHRNYLIDRSLTWTPPLNGIPFPPRPSPQNRRGSESPNFSTASALSLATATVSSSVNVWLRHRLRLAAMIHESRMRVLEP